MFEHARWIWREGGAQQNSVTNFRTTFTLPAYPDSCKISVSAHHFYRFWINGHEVGGLSSPAPSNFQKRKLFLTYDLLPYLCAGENVLAFSVLFLGGDGQNRTCGCPCLIFEVTGACGTNTFCISSGTSCKCSINTAYCLGMPLRERRGMTGSTRLNLSREPEGWKMPGFDDSDWESCILSEANFLVPKLSPQQIPEGKIIRCWEPKCIHTETDFALYDAGEVLTGFARITLRGPKRRLLRLRYGELLQGQRRTWEDWQEPHPISAMRVERGAVNDATDWYLDEYVVQGTGDEVWEECFTYKAFRYFELTGFEDCEILRVEVCKTGTDAPPAGWFRCDEPAATHMAQACLNTQQNNIIGLLVDCPHREQAEYLGDSLMQSHLLCYNFPDAQQLLRKVLQDFADTQLHEGDFPFIAPVDWEPGSMFMLKMPEYDLLYAEILWVLWWQYEDWDALRRFYPVAARTTAFYLSIRNGSGLIPADRPATMHISDWPYSDIDNNGSALFVENVYALQALKRLSEIAKLLGDEDGHSFWLTEHTRMARDIRRAFWDESAGLFRDTPVSSQHHPGVNTLALEAGLFAEAERPAVLRHLLESPFRTRVILSWNYLCTLFENGYAQQAWEFIMDPSTRWGLMMAEGSKTIWEGFEDIESHSHAWNCYPLRLMQQYIAGIHCAAPGFAEVEIAPFFPEGIHQIDAGVYTPLGLLELQGWKEDGIVRFHLELPSDMIGTFRYGGEEISLNGGFAEIVVPSPRL